MNKYFSLVKISHTIFALPFAVVGFVIGIQHIESGWDWKIFLLVVGCMVFARNAAMAFNRLIDARFDILNPRTKNREIPAGAISPFSAKLFIAINMIAFVICTYFINKICFLLSPVALLIILGYSYCKRFTSMAHFVLGLGLALAPIGAYLAVTSQFHIIPILFGATVLFWVSGFDIIYALQDEAIDREAKLHSIPSWLGASNALKLSSVLHLICAVTLVLAAYLLDNQFSNVEIIIWIGVIVFLGMLFYQHTLVKTNDLSKVNLAFFTFNGLASLIFGTLVVLDFYI